MSPRILVIEDDAEWCDQFRDILIDMGYEVDVAKDSSAAIVFLKRSRYSLVLLDVCLDRVEFDFFCQRFCYSLRQRYPELPVVATTGRPLEPQEVETLFELGGVVSFMHKNKLHLPDFRRRIQGALSEAQDNESVVPGRIGGETVGHESTDVSPFNFKKKGVMTKPSVFISYSHKDEGWKDRLVTHLGVLQRQGLLDLWDDRRIGAGEDWYQEIQEAMAAASVAILLVSADFLISSFILDEEIPRLLERRDKEGLRIFPVIVKPSAWKQVKWLSRMQVRPKDGRPLSAGDEYQIDADLTAIATEVHNLLRL